MHLFLILEDLQQNNIQIFTPSTVGVDDPESVKDAKELFVVRDLI